MERRRWIVIVGVVTPVALAFFLFSTSSFDSLSQSDRTPPKISIESNVQLCAAADGPCASLPAANADWTVLRDGESIAAGTLSRAGKATADAPTQATYIISVQLNDLGVEASSQPIVAGGPNALTTVEVDLPIIIVRGEDPRPSRGITTARP